MVNVLNNKITEELSELFKDANECVLVDFNGLSVVEIDTLRASLTENNIRMQVIRNSLAGIVLKEMDRERYEEMLIGPTAVVWGGDGIIQVSKAVHDFSKKTKKLKIKGGFLGLQTIDTEAVTRLTTVPDRPVLLGFILGVIMDPLQGLATGLNSLLSSIVNLIDALHEKRGGEGGGKEEAVEADSGAGTHAETGG
jgi:large subunit ribosomal protein L10